ncbi:MAG: hypothetical protein KF887_07780 [Paracoccaceae bacterium]|nr:MAG: hypothetical protein KF887_07780 [Paracoccaceae bacterium]
MLSPMALGVLAAGAGAAAILGMAWTAIAALSADGRAGRAGALMAVLLGMAVAPLGLRALRARAVAPGEGQVFLGATLILAAAAICLWRLRGTPGAGPAPVLGIGACALLWLVLAGQALPGG